MVSFHVRGDWRPGQVQTGRVESSQHFTGQMRDEIDRAWRKALDRQGVRLFDGPMCRLERWAVAGDQLRLEWSPTSYKLFLGTNLAHRQWAGEDAAAILANPLGVSAVVRTADGFLMLGRRNDSVAYYPGRVHPFAGALEPGDADVFVAIRRELAEELNLEAGDMGQIRCCALAEDAAIRQPELIFCVESRLMRRQIESRVDPAEHEETWSIPAAQIQVHDDEIATPLQSAAPFTPIALAALQLAVISE